MNKPVFTAHNIALDDGTFTMGKDTPPMSVNARFVSAKRLFGSLFHGEKDRVRIVDLGCLEGGYATEFARTGYDTLGVEVRSSNIAACQYVKSKIDLKNLHFAQDDVLNIERYGRFDGTFCCGLFYHLDNPVAYLNTLSKITRKILILQTHFSLTENYMPLGMAETKFRLGPVVEHEGILGRWYGEFPENTAIEDKEQMRWSSWGNHRSFWPTREYLVKSMYDAGFDLVMEEFDSLQPDIIAGMGANYYSSLRGTFIGIKSNE